MADADARIILEDVIAIDEPKLPSRWKRTILMISIPLLLLIGGVIYYVSNDHYVSTDNAYVQQDKVSVSAEVGGRIIEVTVKENQHVKAGDLLFRMDPEPYRIAVAQADASIASAQVRHTGLETDYSITGNDIDSAREDIAFFEKEYRRQSELMERGFTTRARLQSAEHTLSNARSKLTEAEGAAQKARASLASGSAAPGQDPAIASAYVLRQKALLDLARTEIHAPVSGIVSQAERLQVGQMMVTGLPAVSIVASDQSWIEANFKETDLDKMRVGQPAEVQFDAYPELKLRGHVASIGAGTGSEFSVLPAQNATGNWVKVTQRVPVRILIDDKPSRAMIAGLSAHVRIDTSGNGRR